MRHLYLPFLLIITSPCIWAQNRIEAHYSRNAIFFERGSSLEWYIPKHAIKPKKISKDLQTTVVLSNNIDANGAGSLTGISPKVPLEIYKALEKTISNIPEWTPALDEDRIPTPSKITQIFDISANKAKDTMVAKMHVDKSLVPDTGETDKIFSAFEVWPTFPGGQHALTTFLKDNIKYNDAAKQNRVQGWVVLRALVERDGKLMDIKIVKDIGYGLGDEALRVVNYRPIGGREYNADRK